VSYVRQSCDWMKETRKFSLAFPVDILLLSRRNKPGQLMCVPKEVGSRLSEMIHFEVRLVAAYSRRSTSGKRKSPVRSRIFPLPIFIKEDPVCWRQSVLCQFLWKNIRLSGGKIYHYAKDHGSVLVAQSVLVAPSVLMWRITALCRRKAFRVQLVLLGSK